MLQDGGKRFSFESLAAFRNRENNHWKFKLLNILILQGLLPRETKETQSVFQAVQTSEGCAIIVQALDRESASSTPTKNSSSNFRVTP